MRYSRQALMPYFEFDSQQKLGAARVLVAGVGGLGSSVLYYLAAAGVGQITLVDNDKVSLSNLNRQILYGRSDIGYSKVIKARERLVKLNEWPLYTAVHEDLMNLCVNDVLKNVDIVVSCLDNDHARVFLLNACKECEIPIVVAGVSGWNGYVTSIQPDYDCKLYEAQSAIGTQSALGSVVGVVGSIQACEVIKILLDIGDTLFGKILFFDALRYKTDIVCYDGC